MWWQVSMYVGIQDETLYRMGTAAACQVGFRSVPEGSHCRSGAKASQSSCSDGCERLRTRGCTGTAVCNVRGVCCVLR